MGVLSFCLRGLQCRAFAAWNADMCGGVRTGAWDAAPERERPLSFSELIAASAFLDFDGMLNERWLSGREPESGADAIGNDARTPPASVRTSARSWRPPIPYSEKNAPPPVVPGDDMQQFTFRCFRLAAGRRFSHIGLVNKWEIGMQPDTRQTVINVLMFAAAFAVLAAIILMRPAARVAREPAAQSAALSAAVTQEPALR